MDLKLQEIAIFLLIFNMLIANVSKITLQVERLLPTF